MGSELKCATDMPCAQLIALAGREGNEQLCCHSSLLLLLLLLLGSFLGRQPAAIVSACLPACPPPGSPAISQPAGRLAPVRPAPELAKI